MPTMRTFQDGMTYGILHSVGGTGGIHDVDLARVPVGYKRAARDLEALYVAVNDGKSVGELYRMDANLGGGDKAHFGWRLAVNAIAAAKPGSKVSIVNRLGDTGIVVPAFMAKLNGEDLTWEGGEVLVSGAAPRAKNIRARLNPDGEFLVLMVDRNALDTVAVPYNGDVDAAVQEAVDLAGADDYSVLEVAIVTARDAGAARLMSRNARFRTYSKMRKGSKTNPGHEIGRTKSGKMVLHSKPASDYIGFTQADHREAAHLHQKQAKHLRSTRVYGAGGPVAADEHHALWQEHNRLAQRST